MLLHREEYPRHAAGADLALNVVAGGEGLAQGGEHVDHADKVAFPTRSGCAQEDSNPQPLDP